MTQHKSALMVFGLVVGGFRGAWRGGVFCGGDEFCFFGEGEVFEAVGESGHVSVDAGVEGVGFGGRACLYACEQFEPLVDGFDGVDVEAALFDGLAEVVSQDEILDV